MSALLASALLVGFFREHSQRTLKSLQILLPRGYIFLNKAMQDAEALFWCPKKPKPHVGHQANLTILEGSGSRPSLSVINMCAERFVEALPRKLYLQ